MKSKFIILIFVVLIGLQTFAQETAVPDTLPSSSNTDIPVIVANVDSVAWLSTNAVESKWANFKPDPVRVLWMGAIIPGFGQIINRKYWKLPIVYAGFLGCAYAITWNSTRYQSYKLAYKDIIDNNPNTNSHIDIMPEGLTIENYPGGIGTYTTNLQSAFEQSRRYRDLSVIAAIAYYGITLVDAYVDAHLLDYDISPDLSLNIRPALLRNKTGDNSFGMSLNFNLK